MLAQSSASVSPEIEKSSTTSFNPIPEPHTANASSTTTSAPSNPSTIFHGHSLQPSSSTPEPDSCPAVHTPYEGWSRPLSRIWAARDDLPAERSDQNFTPSVPSADMSSAPSVDRIPEPLQRPTSAPRRKSSARFVNEPAPQVPTPTGVSIQKATSLRRRLSRSSTQRLRNWREGLMRRSSTPHPHSSGSGSSSSSNTAVGTGNIVQPPTSPSKRPGKHEDVWPSKLHLANRIGVGKADRKDTPAPLSGSSSMNLPQSREVTGGHHARLAAGRANKQTYPAEQAAWDAQQALNQRRASIGSLSSAADSGADLSSYAGSQSDRLDMDGDECMQDDMRPVTPPPPAPALHDPLAILPTELFLQILENLDARDLANAEQVSLSWRLTASRQSVWRGAFNRQFARKIHTDPAPILVGGAGVGRPSQPNQEWKKMYKARSALEKNWRRGVKEAGKAIYLAGHTDSVYCLQFDEDKIITGSRDRTIRIWDINNYTCKRVIGGPGVKPIAGPKVLRTVDYPDFHLATASVNGTPFGETIYTTPSVYHDASILCLQYDEKILVTGSSDATLLIWDIKTYEPMKRLIQHTGGVLDVALDAKHIISCSKDSRIIVWDRETYEAKGELTGHRGPVNAVQLRGNLLVSASSDGIARLWDLNSMRLIKQFNAKERGLAAVEFSEDMKYVLAGGNDTVTYKFDRETGDELAQFRGHTQLVRSLWLDSQNDRIVSGSYDLDLRVYDFSTGVELWRAEEWTTSWMLAAKSDYRRIVATSQDGRILVVDFGLQKCVKVDDGQPIEDVDLLRGASSDSVIQWRDPWKSTRERDAKELREAMAAALGMGAEDSRF